MRLSSSSLLLSSGAMLLQDTLAFQIHHAASFQRQSQWSIKRKSLLQVHSESNSKNIHEFDYLLGEGSSSSSSQQTSAATSGRRHMVVPGNGDYRFTISTSSFAAPTTLTTAPEETSNVYSEQSSSSSAVATEAEYDPYADTLDAQIGKIQQFQEQQVKGLNMEERLKQMDLQDIVVTFILPAIAVFAGVRWTFNRIATKVEQNADATLESFANEMIYHDGDYDEMKLCVSEFSRKLVWMGPSKTDAMLKRYLETYAKKKTVSPRAISSLSYVFTLFKLSEERAAQVLVSLCKQMGTDKISSAGKLLFFGSRILKSPEGKAALIPIKDLIKSTYRDATVAEELIDTSQQAIAEAAYRATVQGGGRGQTSLTVGWEVLGLDKETATRIFEEEKKEGFVTAREAMYGLQTQKYDKSGNRITDDGKLENPEDAGGVTRDTEVGGGSDSDAPTSNVYECSECGYTLFIAQGRESKFFGPGFKCPECGAPKDKFKGRNVEEDDD